MSRPSKQNWNMSEYDMVGLKKAYLHYFTGHSGKVGGKGQIRHVIACQQLARDGKLECVDGVYSNPKRFKNP